MKETTAIKHYIKKIQRKHKGFCVENSGLVINVYGHTLVPAPMVLDIVIVVKEE